MDYNDGGLLNAKLRLGRRQIAVCRVVITKYGIGIWRSAECNSAVRPQAYCSVHSLQALMVCGLRSCGQIPITATAFC